MRYDEALGILSRFYDPASRAYAMLKAHGELVGGKALAAAAAVSHLAPDPDFIRSAALLHDVGIFLTRSPGLDCRGVEPYVRHGVLGRELLERLGLPRHALVCERHVGAGISAAEVLRFGLPLPARDMLPVTVEEQLVCYADKFFSKNGETEAREKSVDEIVAGLRAHGEEQVARFLGWVERFGSGFSAAR
jgi:uncharacterized protein